MALTRWHVPHNNLMDPAVQKDSRGSVIFVKDLIDVLNSNMPKGEGPISAYHRGVKDTLHALLVMVGPWDG